MRGRSANSMRAVTLRAYAKINLSLQIQRRRSDGFHDLQTIFQSIELHDRITVARQRGPFEIRCQAPGLPVDRTNLIWQAADRLWSAEGRGGEPSGVVITLHKRIPMQAGLGGGSSDAAAALLGLCRAWNTRLGPGELHAVAATLGSDVPFFLIGGTVLGLGRGEQVYPLEDLPPSWVVLVTPSFGVATADAYRWWDEEQTPRSSLPATSRVSPLPPWLAAVPFANDFEPLVFARHPILADVKANLIAAGADIAALSGTGSTVFGVFASRRSAHAAGAKLKKWALARGLPARVVLTRFRRRRRA